jgi:hypothetical protein
MTEEVIHYLKHRNIVAGGRMELVAWCGVAYPKTRTVDSFTHQASHTNCDDCKEAAGLDALAGVP